MKIVHLCLASFFVDDYSYQENMLAKYHVMMGNEVTLIASLLTYDDKGKIIYLDKGSTYISKDGYKVIRLDFKKYPFVKINRILRRYVGTFQTLEQEKPDVIFVHGIQSWDEKQVAKYMKRHHDVKLYGDNHADYYNSAKSWVSKNIQHRLLWRFCVQKVIRYIITYYGVTPWRCEFLKQMYGIPSNKISLLVMGLDNKNTPFDKRVVIRSNIRNELEISSEDFVIVAGGKIDPTKNFHHLLEAVNRINNSNIHIILYGNMTDAMKSLYKDYENKFYIHYIGWLESKDIYKYVFASDLAVFPGTHSVLWEEAVALGIPCIFKRWPKTQHVDIGGNCIFAKRGDVEELMILINRIVDDKRVYVNMFNAAMSDKRKQFFYSEIAKKAMGI